MPTSKWTKNGLTITRTSMRHGCLDHGGVCGWVGWWSNADLTRAGLARGRSLSVLDIACLIERTEPTRVLCHGTKIQ